MIAAHSAEICIRRYNGAPECDVIVVFRGQRNGGQGNADDLTFRREANATTIPQGRLASMPGGPFL
jgi:hypothetical protein